ncbi:retrovirus-related pol polyprotein from transposon TNT 1-94 [Tanacetum coccineum]
MLTQQDIYAAGSENRPLMLNKENYVPWSSRLLRYAKSRTNGKLIYNSIMNGPYVKRMIPEPCDPARTVPVPETFHEQTKDELTEAEIKQMKSDDQAIQTILLDLPEDIYVAVDSCETAQEIWLTCTDGESIESYYHRVLKLMNDFKRNKHFPEKIASNLKFLNNLQPEWSRHVTINIGNHNGVIVVPGIANQNGNGNVVVARAEAKEKGCCLSSDSVLIAQKEKAGIQLQAEEFNVIASVADLDEIEEVNENCIMMANLQQASSSGTQTDKAPVYDSDGSTKVQLPDNYYNDEIFNMFTQEEQYTELLEPIPEPHQVLQNDSNVIYEVSSVEQVAEVEKVNSVNHKMKEKNSELTTQLARYKNQERCFEISKQITALNEEISNLNKQLSKEKSTVSSLQEEKKRLKSDFKIREDELLDKQIQLEYKVKELDNILVKMGQSIQMMHMLLPKPDSFYHTEQKMDLGYQNPFYLKQAQHKQQSLYNGKVLLEKHDPPTVYDSEETLDLAQESRLKMKLLNKEIKPANYTKINHISGVYVSQTAKSREELYFSNTSKTANVSKTISIPNEDFSDDTTPSVARKFLNEIHKIIKDKIFPIVNQVDARVKKFEIQFLKEAKFVRDVQSLANEANESLVKHKALELEIERLLRAVVSQDIMSIVQNNSVVDTSNLQTKLEQCKYDKISYDKAYNDIQQKIEQLQAQMGDQKGKCKDTPCVSNIIDPLPQKFENENVKLEIQNKLHDIIYENAKLRAQLFDKVSEQKNTSKGVDITTKIRRPLPRSNTKNDRVPSVSKSSRIKNKEVKVEDHPRNLLLSKNKKHMKKQKANVSNIANQTKHKAQMWKPKNVGPKEILASPKHGKPRMRLRWSPTGKKLNNKGKIITFSESNGDNVIQICLWCVDSGCSKHMTRNLKLLVNFIWKFLGTVRFGNDYVAAILGFGDLQWGNILITMVYFVKGLGHNLFLVGQFCDSDLEVAFRRNACFVRNLEGFDLLKGNLSTNLYTINLQDMASASPIFLMAHATSTKSWLWHQRLSHLNFDTINDLARIDLVTGLLKFKYHKEHLYPSCEQGKSKRASHPPKPVPNSKSKDEAPKEIKTFLKRITVLLQALVIINDLEDIEKLGAKGDISFFIGYSTNSCAYRVYNRRTKKIIETMNMTFDELSAMAFEQSCLKPGLQSMTSRQISSGLDLPYAPSTITTQRPTEGELDLLFEAMYDDHIGGQPSAAPRTVPAAQAPQVLLTPTETTTTTDTARHQQIHSLKQQAKPTEKHLKEVKMIFRYLRGTVNTGLWYTKDSGFELTRFLDANYTGCKDTFKSTSGGAQFLGEKLVSWSSKKQDCTALSTAEAEYVSLSACCTQVSRRYQLLVQDESRFKTLCSIDKDKFMMKAQVYVSKSSAISDVQALPQKNIIDKITHKVLVIMPKKMLREIVSKLLRP